MTRSAADRRGSRGTSAFSEFARGFACFGRGQLLILQRPRLLWLAALPALLVSAVLFAALIALATYAESLVTWASPFANTWNPAVAQALRWVVAMAVVIGFVYAAVQTFAVVTLTVGRPLYQRIQRAVDLDAGGVTRRTPVGPTRFRPGAELASGLARSLRGGGLVFLSGLVPALGEVGAPVLGAVLGASSVTVEMIEPACAARGVGSLQERRGLVAARRAACLGFGLPAYVALLVPFVGVILFPGAVAGATLLTRYLYADDQR